MTIPDPLRSKVNNIIQRTGGLFRSWTVKRTREKQSEKEKEKNQSIQHGTENKSMFKRFVFLSACLWWNFSKTYCIHGRLWSDNWTNKWAPYFLIKMPFLGVHTQKEWVPLNLIRRRRLELTYIQAGLDWGSYWSGLVPLIQPSNGIGSWKGLSAWQCSNWSS